MSEEREELIKALRGDRDAWPPIDPKANYRTLPAALCDAAAGLLAHQETSGWREPEGWKLVPVEITLNMQHAYFSVIDLNLRRVESDASFGRYASQQEAYRDMLAAAPSPSTSQETT